jgi:hypothetical protein
VARPRGSEASRLALLLDFTSDWGVLAFALWTLIAWAGMATDAPVSVLVPIWLASAVLAGVWLALRRLPADRSFPATISRWQPGVHGSQARWVLAAGAAGIVVFTIVAAGAPNRFWPLAWVAALVVVVSIVAFGRLTSGEEGDPPTGPTWSAHAFAAVVGLGFAGMSLFLNRPSPDDTFYVNRATATAELDRIPVKDVLFTDERLGPTSGAGLPLDSFSAFEGAAARFVDVHGASFTYYLMPPLMTFFATWALWRLLRVWAPRNVVLCFVVGSAYWLFSSESLLTFGSKFVTRMWQGKVIFLAWLIPTIYVLLTRWLRGRDLVTAVLLVAAGVGSIGMTSSAAIVAPLVFGAAAIPLLLARSWRGLPVLVVAALIPFVAGLIVTRFYPLAPQLGGRVRGPAWYFHEIFGTDLVAALGALGLIAAPLLARRGAAARLTGGIVVVSLILLTPRLLPTVSAAADVTGVLRRMLWVVPLPAFVGLLAALPVALVARRVVDRYARLRPAIAAVPAVLVVALLVAFGEPLWRGLDGRSLWASRPTWKVEESNLAAARAILRRYQGPGPVLADPDIMMTIPLLTVEPKAVSALRWYATLLPGPRRPIKQRLWLTEFVEGRARAGASQNVERALADLQVDLVCPRSSRSNVIAELAATGRYAERFRAHGLVCYERV